MKDGEAHHEKRQSQPAWPPAPGSSGQTLPLPPWACSSPFSSVVSHPSCSEHLLRSDTSLLYGPPPFSPLSRLTFSLRASSGLRLTPALQFLSTKCPGTILAASFLRIRKIRATCLFCSPAAMVSGERGFGSTERAHDLSRIYRKTAGRGLETGL